jgi:ADP-heptose:LPS heptosyltransferase
MDNNYLFAKNLNSFYSYIESLSFLNKRIALYGNGTVSKIIKGLFPDNIIVTIDKQIENDSIMPEELHMYEYDFILITVLGRENIIKDYLINTLNILEEKIIYFKIEQSTEISYLEREIRAIKHQNNMKCKFNLLPYAIDDTIDIINLIFYMGIGDYLFVTVLLKEIKQKYPNHKIVAYTTRNTDRISSGIVYDMLLQDKNIDEVNLYNGKPGYRWEEYDFSDAINKISSNSDTIFPINFNHSNKNSRHRVEEIFKSFSMEYKAENMYKPLVFIQKKNYNKSKKITNIINNQTKKVIFLHLEARHCDYSYKYFDELIKKLIQEDYYIVFITDKTNFKYSSKSFYHLDILKYSIYESIAFIASIKKIKYFIAINSVMMHLSSALDIPALGLYIFKDSIQTRQTYYKNLKILTVDKDCYSFLPIGYSKLINEKDTYIEAGHLIHYSADIIIQNFKDFKLNADLE